jgi:hypothetical protein
MPTVSARFSDRQLCVEMVHGGHAARRVIPNGQTVGASATPVAPSYAVASATEWFATMTSSGSQLRFT